MNLADDKTKIDNGFPLSRNFLLEHLTTGAFHNVLGKYVPQYPLKLLPWMPNGIFSQNFPLLPLVQNLQIGSFSILEGLLPVIGGQLEIKAGALTNAPARERAHNFGGALDISVSNYQDNHYHIARDIRRLCNKASAIDMIYGAGSCWFHIDIDRNKAADHSNVELPTIRSVDLITGEIFDGIHAMRGYV